MSGAVIVRDPEAAAAARFDLIVVGGGIQGIMLALEACRRNLRPLLLERGDFAGASSHNSLRILHGGLRYLQSLDLARCQESIRARAFWLRHFPELVSPLPCIMPLSGRGPYRPRVFGTALRINDTLCRVLDGGLLPRGRILGPDEAKETLPSLGLNARAGAGVWYDVSMADAPRLCIEALRWACAGGASALNYVEAREVVVAGGRVKGVNAEDLESGRAYTFYAPLVIDASGPSGRGALLPCRPVHPPLLAWNVLFERPAISSFGLALRASHRGAKTYFAVPWQGRLCIGTGYTPWHGEDAPPALAKEQLDAFIEAMNEAAPGLGLERDEVLRVYTGLLPAAKDGVTPSDRPDVTDNGRNGGPEGLWSVAAVKLTTASTLAERVLDRVCPDARRAPSFAHPAPADAGGADPFATERLRRIAAEEAALHLDDLVLRRLGQGDDPERATELAPAVCRALGWEGRRAALEQRRLHNALVF